MTDEQARALGARAVACSGWRWMPGMLWRTPENAFGCCRAESGRLLHGDVSAWVATFGWPDLRDPCTLGGLLALVREAHGEPGAHAQAGWWNDGPGGWSVTSARSGFDIVMGPFDTEAEALVAALEAAPYSAS